MNRKHILSLMPIFVVSLIGCKKDNPITITKISAKCDKTFNLDDKLNKDDIIVTSHYSDESSKSLSSSDWNANIFFPYTFTIQDVLNDKTIDITYKEFKTSITFEVNAPVLDLKIDLKNKENKYEVGDTINKTDFVVTAVYSVEEKKEREVDDWEILNDKLPYTFKEEDVKDGKKFSIKYKEKSKEFIVSVNNTLNEIKASLVKENDYMVGDSIKKEDIKVNAIYKNYKKDVSDWTSDITFPYTFTEDDAKLGKIINISYGGLKTTLKPKVVAPITGISAALREVKPYVVGDVLNKQDIKVLAKRVTGEEEVSNWTCDQTLPYTFTNDDIGNKVFNITYTTFKDKVTIEVIAKKKEGEVDSSQWSNAFSYILNNDKKSKYTLISKDYIEEKGGFKVDEDKHQFTKETNTWYQKYLYKTYFDHEAGLDKKTILDNGLPPKSVDELYTWLKYYKDWFKDAKYSDTEHNYTVYKKFEKYQHSSTFKFDNDANLIYVKLYITEDVTNKEVLNKEYNFKDYKTTEIKNCPDFNDINVVEFDKSQEGGVFKEFTITKLKANEPQIVVFDTKDFTKLTETNQFKIIIDGTFDLNSDFDLYDLQIDGVGIMEGTGYSRTKTNNHIEALLAEGIAKQGNCIVFNLSDNVQDRTEIKIRGTIVD